jgi:hypothetical protein
MGDLGPIHQDVRFDWAAAARLSAELRRTASLLEDQVPHRNAIAASARTEWRGVFSEQFLDRMKVCTGDAVRFADALRQAAHDLDSLAVMARKEQDRRERARAWEAENKSEGLLEKAWEGFWGTDEKPFSEPPIVPPNVEVRNPSPAGRV